MLHRPGGGAQNPGPGACEACKGRTSRSVCVEPESTEEEGAGPLYEDPAAAAAGHERGGRDLAAGSCCARPWSCALGCGGPSLTA